MPSDLLFSRSMLEEALTITEGALLVYDVSDEASFRVAEAVAEVVRERFPLPGTMDGHSNSVKGSESWLSSPTRGGWNTGEGRTEGVEAGGRTGRRSWRPEYALMIVGNKADLFPRPSLDAHRGSVTCAGSSQPPDALSTSSSLAASILSPLTTQANQSTKTNILTPLTTQNAGDNIRPDTNEAIPPTAEQTGYKPHHNSRLPHNSANEEDGPLSTRVSSSSGALLSSSLASIPIFLEISAKTGANVTEAFTLLGEEILRIRQRVELERQRLQKKGEAVMGVTERKNKAERKAGWPGLLGRLKGRRVRERVIYGK